MTRGSSPSWLGTSVEPGQSASLSVVVSESYAGSDVRIPVHVGVYSDVNVSIVDEAHKEIGAQRFSAAAANSNVVLLEIAETSKLRGAIHEAPIAPAFTPWAVGGVGSYSAGPTLVMSSPRFDPATGDPILTDDGTRVGDVRSVAYSPALGGIALALVRREVEPGTVVRAGDHAATVVSLPFSPTA